jgi:small-conductance mechanosensitive channel/CRP-like cAMP-binding protein
MIDFSQNTALLLASLLLMAIATEVWLRLRHPLWRSLVVRIGGFALLTWLVKVSLGSPLRPQFATDRSAMLLWQQIVELGWWIVGARAVTIGVRALAVLENRPHQSRIVSDLVGAAIYIAAGLAITNFAFSVPIGGLLATSGVIAIVLGLALQSTLSDVFSGIAVGLERPYQPGDLLWVEGEIEGIVVQMGWRSTQIRTGQNNMAIVPNSVIAKSRLINRNSPTPIRAETMTIRLDPRVDPARCLAVLTAAVRSCMLPLIDPAPRLAYTGLLGDGGAYEIAFSVGSSENVQAVQTEILSKVHRHLLHAGIALAVAGNPAPPTVPETTIVELLARSEVFGALSQQERDLLAQHFVMISIEAEETLFRQDDVPDALYLIASGTVEVTRVKGGARQIMTRISPGESVGLVGVFTGQPHLATVTALTPVGVFRLDKAGVDAALKVCPDMATGLEALARRQANAILGFGGMRDDGSRDHAHDFLFRLRQALHRLAA